jgi:hypothetical protein
LKKIFSSETAGDNDKSYLSFNSLGKSYLSFNRGEDFLEINHSETRIACDGHVCKPIALKLLGQMNRNLVGSIYGRSSIKIAHFVSIGLQTWPSQAILVSEWLNKMCNL